MVQPRAQNHEIACSNSAQKPALNFTQIRRHRKKTRSSKTTETLHTGVHVFQLGYHSDFEYQTDSKTVVRTLNRKIKYPLHTSYHNVTAQRIRTHLTAIKRTDLAVHLHALRVRRTLHNNHPPLPSLPFPLGLPLTTTTSPRPRLPLRSTTTRPSTLPPQNSHRNNWTP